MPVWLTLTQPAPLLTACRFGSARQPSGGAGVFTKPKPQTSGVAARPAGAATASTPAVASAPATAAVGARNLEIPCLIRVSSSGSPPAQPGNNPTSTPPTRAP